MGHKKADDDAIKNNNQTSSRVPMAVDTCYSAYGGTFIDSSLQVFVNRIFSVPPIGRSSLAEVELMCCATHDGPPWLMFRAIVRRHFLSSSIPSNKSIITAPRSKGLIWFATTEIGQTRNKYDIARKTSARDSYSLCSGLGSSFVTETTCPRSY
jgi:hypothetical protein